MAINLILFVVSNLIEFTVHIFKKDEELKFNCLIKFRDDRARISISGPLALSARLKGKRIVLVLKFLTLNLLLAILRNILGDEILEYGILTLWSNDLC